MKKHEAPHYAVYPVSCYFLPSGPKYHRQHPICAHPQSLLFP